MKQFTVLQNGAGKNNLTNVQHPDELHEAQWWNPSRTAACIVTFVLAIATLALARGASVSFV